MSLLEKANRGGERGTSTSKRGFFAKAAAARSSSSEDIVAIEETVSIDETVSSAEPEPPHEGDSRAAVEARGAGDAAMPLPASPVVQALFDGDAFSEYETFDDNDDYPVEEYVSDESNLFELPPLPGAEELDDEEPFPETEVEPIREPDLFLEAELPSELPRKPEAGEKAKPVIEGLERIRLALEGLPSAPDRLLSLWRFLYEGLPLGAYALLLRSGDFLSVAANSGFPLGATDSIPYSFARKGLDAASPLEAQDLALIAPILGLGKDASLRASTMLASDGEPVGLWILCDESLDSLDPGSLAQLDSLLSGASGPQSGLEILMPATEPAKELLASVSSFNSAVAIAFDLSEMMSDSEDQEPYLRSIAPEAARSAFASSCALLLRHGGAALPYGRRGVGYVLGCGAPADPELAFFQFSKTLRRAAPFLSSIAFPKGRCLSLSPSAPGSLEALAAFLAE